MSQQPTPNPEEIPIREARSRFSELLGRTEYAKERIKLTRHGKVVAYLVPPEDVETLQTTETQEYRKLLAEIKEGMDELAQGLGIPLDEVETALTKLRKQ